MKQLIFLFCLATFIYNNSLFGQSPYQTNKKQEIVLWGAGAISLGTGIYLGTQLDLLTQEEITLLDRNTINSFDKSATFNHSDKAGNLSDVFLLSSHVLPGLFLIHKKTRADFGKIALIYGETFLLAEGLTNFTKRLVHRTRPLAYNESFSLEDKMTKSARLSFFSGHTSVTTANYFFTAKVFSDYFPDSKWKGVVWGTAIGIPALTGYLRVKAGKHYPTDVISGYAVGALVGYLVPHIHKKIKQKKAAKQVRF